MMWLHSTIGLLALTSMASAQEGLAVYIFEKTDDAHSTRLTSGYSAVAELDLSVIQDMVDSAITNRIVDTCGSIPLGLDWRISYQLLQVDLGWEGDPDALSMSAILRAGVTDDKGSLISSADFLFRAPLEFDIHASSDRSTSVAAIPGFAYSGGEFLVDVDGSVVDPGQWILTKLIDAGVSGIPAGSGSAISLALRQAVSGITPVCRLDIPRLPDRIGQVYYGRILSDANGRVVYSLALLYPEEAIVFPDPPPKLEVTLPPGTDVQLSVSSALIDRAMKDYWSSLYPKGWKYQVEGPEAVFGPGWIARGLWKYENLAGANTTEIPQSFEVLEMLMRDVLAWNEAMAESNINWAGFEKAVEEGALSASANFGVHALLNARVVLGLPQNCIPPVPSEDLIPGTEEWAEAMANYEQCREWETYRWLVEDRALQMPDSIRYSEQLFSPNLARRLSEIEKWREALGNDYPDIRLYYSTNGVGGRYPEWDNAVPLDADIVEWWRLNLDVKVYKPQTYLISPSALFQFPAGGIAYLQRIHLTDVVDLIVIEPDVDVWAHGWGHFPFSYDTMSSELEVWGPFIEGDDLVDMALLLDTGLEDLLGLNLGVDEAILDAIEDQAVRAPGGAVWQTYQDFGAFLVQWPPSAGGGPGYAIHPSQLQVSDQGVVIQATIEAEDVMLGRRRVIRATDFPPLEQIVPYDEIEEPEFRYLYPPTDMEGLALVNWNKGLLDEANPSAAHAWSLDGAAFRDHLSMPSLPNLTPIRSTLHGIRDWAPTSDVLGGLDVNPVLQTSEGTVLLREHSDGHLSKFLIESVSRIKPFVGALSEDYVVVREVMYHPAIPRLRITGPLVEHLGDPIPGLFVDVPEFSPQGTEWKQVPVRKYTYTADLQVEGQEGISCGPTTVKWSWYGNTITGSTPVLSVTVSGNSLHLEVDPLGLAGTVYVTAVLTDSVGTRTTLPWSAYMKGSNQLDLMKRVVTMLEHGAEMMERSERIAMMLRDWSPPLPGTRAEEEFLSVVRDLLPEHFEVPVFEPPSATHFIPLRSSRTGIGVIRQPLSGVSSRNELRRHIDRMNRRRGVPEENPRR